MICIGCFSYETEGVLRKLAAILSCVELAYLLFVSKLSNQIKQSPANPDLINSIDL